VVDGSLCPCWSWADSSELYSGKHTTTGHAHQFVCDLAGNLLHISDPLPGKTHDAKAMDDTGLSELLDDENSFGDKGYLGTGITVPYRKPAGGELLDWQKGHLMIPRQHQTTTDVKRSRSRKFEVIASISNQPKQRFENQRVWGSSPWRCTVAANQAIAGSFCYPIGRSTYRNSTEALPVRVSSRHELCHALSSPGSGRTRQSTLGAHV
jgi:YD repeat-containing protein